MNEKINFLGDLQRLEVKPGDKFVLTSPHLLSMAEVEHIQTAWAQFIGADGPKLLVLQEGMKLGAIGEEAQK